MNNQRNKVRHNDFYIDIDGVGQFRFNRKTYGAQIVLDATMSRILGANFVTNDTAMNTHATLVGLYSALMVSCPEGWEDLESIDMSEDPDIDVKILDLYFALRAKLDSFRVAKGPAGADAAGQVAGEGAVPVDSVLGASQVQPAAD
jgi:hypothetical protein